MTNEEHNKWVSWAFLGYAALQLMMVLLTIVLLELAFSTDLTGTPRPPQGFLTLMAIFVTVFYGALLTPALIAAYAVRKKRPWARVAAIVASVVTLISFPIGTMVSVYSFWFFMGDPWRQVYGKGFADTPEQLPAFDHRRWEGGFNTDEQGRAVFTPAEPPDWR